MEIFFQRNLEHLMKERGETQASIALVVNKKHNTVGNWLKGIGGPDIHELSALSQFFDVSYNELLHSELSKGKIETTKENNEKGKIPGKETGKIYPENDTVSLLKESNLSRMPQVVTIDSSGRDRAVLVQARARAGYLSGYADPEYIERLPSYELPGYIGRLNRLFEVQGNSMSPTLHDKDIVVGQFTENLRQVRDDRVHVIVTKEEGIVVKRVLNRIDKENVLVLKSDNYRERDNFPTIVLYPEDVLEIWYVAGFISRQLPPPNEQYERMNDMEVRLTLLAERITKAGL